MFKLLQLKINYLNTFYLKSEVHKFLHIQISVVLAY
jgi:hypothetical protein